MYDFIIVDSPALNSCIDEKLTKEGVSISGVIENKISLDSYKNYLKDYDYFQEKKYLHGNHLSFDKF